MQVRKQQLELDMDEGLLTWRTEAEGTETGQSEAVDSKHRLFPERD